jgi:type I restriction enzyme S subunit
MYLQSPVNVDFLSKQLKGSDQPFLNKGGVMELKIPCPPLNEQKRIVGVLTARLARELADFRRIRKLFTVLKSGVLSSAFSGRLVPQDPFEGTGHQLLEQILAAKANSDSTKPPSPKAKKRKSSK